MSTKAPRTPKTPRAPRTRSRSSKIPGELKIGIAAAHDKKAENLVVLDLRKDRAFTDFFIICTGTNVRQVQAIADAIQASLSSEGVKPTVIEGTTKAEWVLLDYFDFVVHIFTPATREFYGLERLWGDAERIEIPA